VHSTSLAAGRRCPVFAFALAVAVVSDLASAVDTSPVERSGTGDVSTARGNLSTIIAPPPTAVLCTMSGVVCPKD